MTSRKMEIIKETRVNAKTGRVNSVSFLIKRKGGGVIARFATLKDAENFKDFTEKHKLKKVM